MGTSRYQPIKIQSSKDYKQDKKGCSERGRCLMPKENIQQTFQELYERAKRREVFTDLMSIVLNRENILLAYREIKNNSGSNTSGTDSLTIKDIERFTAEEVIAKVRLEVSGKKDGYQPRPVRRKDILKPNGDTRPLGVVGKLKMDNRSNE